MPILWYPGSFDVVFSDMEERFPEPKFWRSAKARNGKGMDKCSHPYKSCDKTLCDSIVLFDIMEISL